MNGVEQAYRSYTEHHEILQNLTNKRDQVKGDIYSASQQVHVENRSSSICDIFDYIKSFILINEDAVKAKTQARQLENRINSLKDQQEEIQNEINTINLKLIGLSKSVFDSNRAKDLIIIACGGEEKYAQIKTLDLGDRMGYQGNIDMIIPNDMSAPVMRFTDKTGRIGIAVCAKADGSEKCVVQTFYQFQFDSPNWISRGGKIIQVGFLISNGVLSTSAFDQLKLLLKNELPGWKLAK